MHVGHVRLLPDPDREARGREDLRGLVRHEGLDDLLDLQGRKGQTKVKTKNLKFYASFLASVTVFMRRF